MFVKSWTKGWFFYLFLVSTGVFLSGCGQATSSSSGSSLSCSAANQAHIQVGEGFLTPLCGCNGPGEGAGTIFSRGQVLTCHLAQPNTQVIFQFGKAVNPHQIVPSGTPSLTPTPWVPGRGVVPLAYPVYFGQSATTYSFQDATTGMTGQIIVP